MSVLLETTLGDVVIDLFTKDRPRACLNFLKLCKLKMYNYCLFHNVQRNFIIQTGDIDEQGGCSVFKVLYGDQAKLFEKEDVPKMKHTAKLTVSMVNDGNGYHGSQFLITTVESADTLDGLHTVFGTVAEGAEVIDQINEAYCDDKGRPYQDIRINHTIILHDPFDDPDTLPVPPRSPSPPPSVLESDRLAVGEAVNKLAGHTTEEVVEYIEEKELKANTQMLEIIGDIPDADMKPPENVLFVCKLNPVTTSDDLEIIFSRFGTIESCEVIRDWKTGDSLCYAFIEFEDVTACEAAYFKMDNVLIDERRIHVDFSQSVSKLYWNRNTKNQMKYSDQKGNGRDLTADNNKHRENDKSRRDDRVSKSGRGQSGARPRFDGNRSQHQDSKSRRNDDLRGNREFNHSRMRREDNRLESKRGDKYFRSKRDEDSKPRSKRDSDYSRSRSDRDSRPRKDNYREHRDLPRREDKVDRIDHRKPKLEREHRRSNRESEKDSNRSTEDRKEDYLKSRKHNRDEVRNENIHREAKQSESDSSSERDHSRDKKRKKGHEVRKEIVRREAKQSESDSSSERGHSRDKKRKKGYETKKKNQKTSEEKQNKKKKKKKMSSSSSESSSSLSDEEQIKEKKERKEEKKASRHENVQKRGKTKEFDSKEERKKAKELQAEIAKLQSKIKKMKEEDEEELKTTARKQKKKKHKV